MSWFGFGKKSIDARQIKAMGMEFRANLQREFGTDVFTDRLFDFQLAVFAGAVFKNCTNCTTNDLEELGRTLTGANPSIVSVCEYVTWFKDLSVIAQRMPRGELNLDFGTSNRDLNGITTVILNAIRPHRIEFKRLFHLMIESRISEARAWWAMDATEGSVIAFTRSFLATIYAPSAWPIGRPDLAQLMHLHPPHLERFNSGGNFEYRLQFWTHSAAPDFLQLAGTIANSVESFLH